MSDRNIDMLKTPQSKEINKITHVMFGKAWRINRRMIQGNKTGAGKNNREDNEQIFNEAMKKMNGYR